MGLFRVVTRRSPWALLPPIVSTATAVLSRPLRQDRVHQLGKNRCRDSTPVRLWSRRVITVPGCHRQAELERLIFADRGRVGRSVASPRCRHRRQGWSPQSPLDELEQPGWCRRPLSPGSRSRGARRSTNGPCMKARGSPPGRWNLAGREPRQNMPRSARQLPGEAIQAGSARAPAASTVRSLTGTPPHIPGEWGVDRRSRAVGRWLWDGRVTRQCKAGRNCRR